MQHLGRLAEWAKLGHREQMQLNQQPQKYKKYQHPLDRKCESSTAKLSWMNAPYKSTDRRTLKPSDLR
jgi:hypothetical protein